MLKKVVLLSLTGALLAGLGGCVVAPAGPRPYADRDADGVPNRYDRDKDNDGVRNRNDDRPRNPYVR